MEQENYGYDWEKDGGITEQETCQNCWYNENNECTHSDVPAKKVNPKNQACYHFKQEHKKKKSHTKKEKTTKKKKTEPQKTKFTSYLDTGNQVYEQVHGFKYLCYNKKTKEIREEPLIDHKGQEYWPINAEEIQREIVTLPHQASEYGTVQELIQEIREYIHRYLDVGEDYEYFAATYILLTWVYDKMDTINYLRTMGDTGTGKSRFLNVIGKVCYKSIMASGSVTLAPLKRITDKWRGTILIDEGDFQQSDEKSELVKFLNLGFENGQTLMNCDKDNPQKLEFFNPYCPKIISTRRQFTDVALEARCLTHINSQTDRKDIPVILPKECREQQKALRNKLLRFRFDFYDKINHEGVIDSDMGDVEPRIKQATKALAVLMNSVGECYDELLMFIKEYQKKIIDERSESYDGIIVNALVDYVVTVKKYLTVKELLEFMENKGVGWDRMTTRSVGKRLKTLGFSTKICRIDGVLGRYVNFEDKCNKLYQTLQKNARRYVVDEEKLKIVTDVTFVTDNVNTLKNNKKVQKGLDTLYPQENVTNVTNVKSEEIEIEQIEIQENTQPPNDLQQNQQIDKLEYIKKHGEKKVSELLKKGDIYEPRKGIITKLE